jgi:membrane protein implicated in regulation of membrane protease activity
VRFLDLVLGLIALLGVVVIAAVLAGGRPYLAAVGMLLLAVGTLAFWLRRAQALRKNRHSSDALAGHGAPPN